MILYIHGFASCGAGNKVQVLQAHFGEDQVISPNLPVEPEQAISFLQGLVEENQIQLLVGSSLGGFYADWLNAHYQIPSVLINPSTRPFDTLDKYIGQNKNWCTGEQFEWKAEYQRQLKSLYREAADVDERFLVLLQTDDEVLDYRLAQSRYRHHHVIVEQGGNHRFENLSDYLQQIGSFSQEKEPE